MEPLGKDETFKAKKKSNPNMDYRDIFTQNKTVTSFGTSVEDWKIHP